MNPAHSKTEKWYFAVDRGGTFTDVIGIAPDGKAHITKLLSESSDYQDASIEGIRQILQDGGKSDVLSSANVTNIRMGTTVATNALLERRGTPTALFITAGFEDLLEIGDQTRPDIFSLAIRKPEILYKQVKDVEERITAEGKIEIPLNIDKVRVDLETTRKQGFQAVAIVLMHAWKNPVHEEKVAELAFKFGFKQVSISHRIMPLIKIVGRGQTTLVDAYLAPSLQHYVDSVQREVKGVPVDFMKSSGGLVSTDNLRAKDTILSGPAGGVIGYATITRTLGLTEVIGFDMGGTSTDVSRFGGEFARVFETVTGGIKYQTDQLDVETVAAGGGSILWFDGQKFNVGPESAGADPGPACYGCGGPLTVTDANLLLGRILPEYMPSTFGPNNDQPLDTIVTEQKFVQLTQEINQKLGLHYIPEEVAEGFIRVANEVMGRAIKKISIARGYDLRRHTLICFGGAAPQHACDIARTLGIKRIVIHPLAGVLSAYGIAVSERVERDAVALMTVYTEEIHANLLNQFGQLRNSVILRLGKDLDRNQVQIQGFIDLRPLGSDTYLTIPIGTDQDIYSYEQVIHNFHQRYQHRFGFYPPQDQVEAVNLRIEAAVPGQILKEHPVPFTAELPDDKGILKFQNVYFNGKLHAAPVFRRRELKPGNSVAGPAIIVDDYSTIVIEPDFKATINTYGHVVLETISSRKIEVSRLRDPVLLEVYNHLFMSIAEQMGYTLANTAHSVNMKERLDFSCAIFDREGNLVANAPHIPVHLGAMGESVKYIKEQNTGKMNPGDVYVTNNPHNGGSHLPDITVVSPVFISSGKLVFFVASRGHHADIGGITPGSMPPFGTTAEEEGVVIDNFLLVSENQLREREVRELLLGATYPARNVKERLSDLRAQVAANNKGIQELKRLVRQYTLPVVSAYMQHIQINAMEAMTNALGNFLKEQPVFEGQFEDYLDDGSRIAVSIRIERGENPPASHRMFIDFSKTSAETKGNLNAPVAVTKAAVLYVLRTLIDRDIPLNAGCLKPVKIHIPKGCLLNPSPRAAVVGGNVETSQRVVDVLYGALEVAAASQGTMNNFLFGREDGKGQQYYETVAGGSGAIEGQPGTSAVQVHMTNTRITDPEVLEYRFPEIFIDRFKIRRGSGGLGKWVGGDGVERAVRFQKPMHVSILSERRKYPPYGIKGGEPGKKGINLLVRKDGTKIELGGKVDRIVEKGETIVIQTPGGGGYGALESENQQ